MKLILLAFICVLSSYIGFKLSYNIKQKLAYCEDFYNFLEHIHVHISFTKEEIVQIIDHYMFKTKKFKDTLMLYKIYLTTYDKNQFINNLNKIISKDSKTLILDFLINFGEINYVNQMRIIEKELTIAQRKKCEWEKVYKTKGGLYYKLGLIIGVLLMILLI